MSSKTQLIHSLINRIASRLPANSRGQRAADSLEHDPIIQQTVSAVIELSTHKPAIVAEGLCALLKTLKPPPYESLSHSALKPQRFVLRVLSACLQHHWRYHQRQLSKSRHSAGSVDSAVVSSGFDDEKSRPLPPLPMTDQDFVDPPPLDEALVKQLMDAMLHFVNRTHTLEQDNITASLIMDHTGDTRARIDPKARDLVMENYKVAGEVLYYISASNWNIYYKMLNNTIKMLLEKVGDSGQCPPELRILEFACLNRKRLHDVLTEMSSSFMQMKRQGKMLFSKMMRRAIWHWIETHPYDFADVCASTTRPLPGSEILFDICSSAADDAQKKSVLWPLQTILLVLSPDLLAQAVVGSNSSQNRRVNFLNTLKSALGTARTADIATVCYVDLCKASTYVPAGEDSVLRHIADDIERDLRSKVIDVARNSSLSADLSISAQQLATDFLLARLRLHPATISQELEDYYLRDDAPIAFRKAFVKSCLTILQDQNQLHWNPTISSMRPSLSHHLRILFMKTATIEVGNVGLHSDPSLFNPGPKRTASMATASHVVTGRTHDTATLLLDLLLLFRLDPLLALSGDGPSQLEQNRAFMEELVNLLRGNDVTMRQAAVECLTILHSPNHIDQWGPSSSLMTNFWCISSHVVFLVARQILSKKLNDDNLKLLLGLLTDLLIARNKFLRKHQDNASEGADTKERLQASVALEIALLVSLCSSTPEICSDALRCFNFLCAETNLADMDADSVQSQITLKSNLAIYTEMASEDTVFLGRKAQQKRVRKYLRMMTRPTPGALAAWEEAHMRWNTLTLDVSKFGEEVREEIIAVEHHGKKSGKADKGRPIETKPVATVRIDDEEKRTLWMNYTGFLAALGACCLDAEETNNEGQHHRTKTGDQAAMIDRFIKDMTDKLTDENAIIREGVKEALGHDLSPALYPNLVKHLEAMVATFFVNNEAVCTESRTLLVEQSVLVLKLILDRLADPGDYLLGIDFSMLIRQFADYLSKLSVGYASLRIKIKMCQLIETLMVKKEQIIIRDGMRLRNKLLEIVVEWTSYFALQTTGTKVYSNAAFPKPTNEKLHRDLDQACLKTIVALLDRLPLQPLEPVREQDPAQVKSRLFYRYFKFFLNLLERCRINEMENGMSKSASGNFGRDFSPPSLVSNKYNHGANAGQDLAPLKHYTILAMSNLLRSNVDAGLKYSLAMGYHDDTRTRTAFMQVLTNILNQGAEFEVLAENVMADRYEKLVDLFVESDIEIALSLCNVCPASDTTSVAEILLKCFDNRHKVLLLLQSVITKEVASTEQEATLFRGTTMATRLVSIFTSQCCSDYVRSTLMPALELINGLSDQEHTSELDPQKVPAGEDVNVNKKNVIKATSYLLDAICTSPKKAPRIFREELAIIVEAVQKRFPEAKDTAVGNFVFLRLFGPAILTSDENTVKNKKVRRLLMQATRVMQNLANGVLYGPKETHMIILNDFLTDNFYRVRSFLREISEVPQEVEHKVTIGNIRIEEKVCAKLHRYLFDNLDRMSRDLSGRKVNSDVETETLLSWKRTLDKLSTLIAQLGRPAELTPQKNLTTHYNEFMRRNSHRSVTEISKSNSFYKAGTSIQGNPIFVMVSRNIHGENFDYELLVYYMLKVMEPYLNKPYEVALDTTGFSPHAGMPEHWFVQLFRLMGAKAANLVLLHIFNPNSYLQRYVHKLPLELTNSLVKRSYFYTAASEIQKQMAPGETLLLKSTLDLEAEGGNTYAPVKQLQSLKDSIMVTIKVGEYHIFVKTEKKQVILWSLTTVLNDVFHISDVEDMVELPTSNEASSTRELMIRFTEGTTIVISTTDRDEIVARIRHSKQKCDSTKSGENRARGIYRAIRPNDVPGRLLNMTLLNIGSEDPALRLAAYNLLYSLSLSFRFNIGNQLMSARDLCIPANSTDFIVGISESLAATEPHLTLEFLNECFVGFNKSTDMMRQLCLDYMSPWLHNLVVYSRIPNDNGGGVSKVRDVLRLLIDMTVKQTELYKHFQAKAWRTISRVDGLVDLVLDEFVQYSVYHDIGTIEAEAIADTLATMAGVSVRGKVITRLRRVLQLTSARPCKNLIEHGAWKEIVVLTRFTLMLSFNISMHIKQCLPEVFHVITMLMHTGPTLMRTTVHELAVNVIHALCTGMPIGEENVKKLNFLLSDLCNGKNRLLFGLTKSHANSFTISKDTLTDHSDAMKLSSLESTVHLLLEVLSTGAPSSDVANMWRARWMSLVTSTAFQFNPAIQPRSFVVLGCLVHDEVDDDLIYQILVALRGALAIFKETDSSLIVSILMCLGNVIDDLPADSRYLHSLFWLAIALIQLGHDGIFPSAVQFLQSVLRALDSHKIFASRPLSDVLLEAREPVLEVAKKLDIASGVSFDTHFSFAVAGILLGNSKHCDPKDLVYQCLTTFLEIECKLTREQNIVGADMLGYLAGLLAFAAHDNALSELLRLAGMNDIELDEQDFGSAYVRIFDALEIPDNTTALLLVSLLATMLNSAETDAERLFLYSFLSEAAVSIPEVFALVYESLLAKMNESLARSQNYGIVDAVKSILLTACSEPAFSYPVSRRNQVSYLEELGFSSFALPNFSAAKPNIAHNAQLASLLLDKITE